MKQTKTAPKSSNPKPESSFFAKGHTLSADPFFSPLAQPPRKEPPAIQRTLDWDEAKMARLAGGKSFRSEEYKNILRAISTYKEMIEPGPLPDSMKVDRLYELQGYAITWLEKHKDDANDPTVETRRKAIEDFAYRSIIQEITRLGGEYNKGKSQGIIGKGQVSEVKAVDYTLPDHSVEKRLFKPSEESYDESVDSAKESGIPTSRALLSNRAVATSVLDKLFGFHSTVSTDFAFDPDNPQKFGIAMEIAPGLSPQIAHHEKTSYGDMELHFYREFKMEDIELQKQLSTLQVFDAITGQVDRHPGNYFVRQTGSSTTVMGIDNDFSFGKSHTDVSKGGSEKSKYHSFPAYVQKSVAQKIRGKSESEIRTAIRPLLPPKEVDATILRFKSTLAQLDLLEKQGHLLDDADWGNQTAKDSKEGDYARFLQDNTEKKKSDAMGIAYNPDQTAFERSRMEKKYTGAYGALFSLISHDTDDLKKGVYPPAFKAKTKEEFKKEVKKVYQDVLKENVNIAGHTAIQMRIDFILDKL
ncbi:MAG: hypothetical protein SF052_25280 [Bacteroidia bacterium]|nr:hypothetical protein [Bacteroidia bacterium]